MLSFVWTGKKATSSQVFQVDVQYCKENPCTHDLVW